VFVKGLSSYIIYVFEEIKEIREWLAVQRFIYLRDYTRKEKNKTELFIGMNM